MRRLLLRKLAEVPMFQEQAGAFRGLHGQVCSR